MSESTFVKMPHCWKSVSLLKCQIYVRRASGAGKDKTTQQINMKQASDFIKKIDYAWLRHGKEGHRKVIKNGTLISDNTL